MKSSVILILVAVVLAGYTGCSYRTRHKAIIAKDEVFQESIPPVAPQKDTVYLPAKKMTPAELQAYLLPFYKANYDNFFAPEFRRMNIALAGQQSTINSLSTSNQMLATMMQEMRKRSIHRIDSSNNAYKELQKIYFDEQKKQVHTNAVQINNLKDITNVLLAVGVLMFLVLVTLALVVRIQWNRLNRLITSL